MRNPLGFTTEKPCVACPAVVVRPGDYSNRKWLKRTLCDACELLDIRARILARTEKNAAGCWLWTGSTRNGYGQIQVHDRVEYTHRLMFTICAGPIPEGLYVCHRCDERKCNNPEHFFLGTHLDNVADMIAKGRQPTPPRIVGEANHKATLTDEQVREVRRLRADGVSQRAVAKMFGIGQSAVWNMVHGHTRKTA